MGIVLREMEWKGGYMPRKLVKTCIKYKGVGWQFYSIGVIYTYKWKTVGILRGLTQKDRRKEIIPTREVKLASRLVLIIRTRFILGGE